MANFATLVTREVLAAFSFEHAESATIFLGGHINDTFLVICNEKQWLLQRINSYVFKNPTKMMENLIRITSFLKDKVLMNDGNPERECLQFIMTKDNESVFRDADGEYWRCAIFINDTVTYETPINLEMLYESGVAFGNFQRMLDGYPADTLFETIPNFHNTQVRFHTFKDSVDADAKKRAQLVKNEIQFVLNREDDCRYLTDLLQSGEIPLRVTHNDTKLSNILMDAKTNQAVCVIDLDTIMPGLVCYDFGDSMRAGATTAAEDETDLTKVHFDLDHFEAFAKGFLFATKSFLTPKEIKTLSWGVRTMILEVGMRFLTDYLDGDLYFKTKYPNHNLDRAKNQFKLLSEMEQKQDEMDAIVLKYS